MNKNFYQSLSGKKIAISGSTGGIGSALCEHISALGGSIVCLDRNADKVAALIKKVKKEHPHTTIEHIYMDLENPDSVKAAAEALKASGVDILVLCAGAYHIPRRICAGGYDNIFQINFLAPYYLASIMKPFLETRGGRLVAVGSLSQVIARLDETDPQGLKSRPAAAYGSAKLRLMLSLTRLFEGSDVLSLTHPGISPTGITSGYPKFIRGIIKYPMRLIFMSPKKASICVLRGIFLPTPKGSWMAPRVLGIWGRPRLAKMRSYSDVDADTVSSQLENYLKSG